MKNSNDTIGNRTRDMNQLRHRLPRSHIKVLNIYDSSYKYLYYGPYGQWNVDAFLVKMYGYIIIGKLCVVCWNMQMATSTMHGTSDVKQVSVLRMWHRIICDKEAAECQRMTVVNRVA